MMREEQAVEQAVKEWEAALREECQSRQDKRVLEAIDRIQQEAFMEGYRYAIEVLKEGMVKREEK